MALRGDGGKVKLSELSSREGLEVGTQPAPGLSRGARRTEDAASPGGDAVQPQLPVFSRDPSPKAVGMSMPSS